MWWAYTVHGGLSYSGGGGLYSEVCRSGLDLTSAKIKGPSTNQMRLIYPINQSDVY